MRNMRRIKTKSEEWKLDVNKKKLQILMYK